MINLLFVIGACITLCPVFYVFVYLIQLNRYEILQTLKTSGKTILKIIGVFVVLDLCNCCIGIITIDKMVLHIVINVIKLIVSVVFINKIITKNRLQFTYRVWRQLIINLFVMFCLLGLEIYLKINCFEIITVLISFIISFYVSKGIEYLIAHVYIYKARKKLEKHPNIIKIAITGSYGKTTTKLILTEILKSKFVVKCTPKSYNTPMGITKFILGEDLNNVDILVFEMGAVRNGDILKLCKIINPDYGILTSIGLQHLETFKSINNIIKTKFELVDYLYNKNKLVVCNYNNKYISNNCIKYSNIAPVSVCIAKSGVFDIGVSDNNTDNIDNCYVIQKCDKFGSFIKYINITTKTIGYLSTMIVGVPYIIDIALASTMAIELKVDFEDIKNAVLNLNYVDNRMEVKKSLNGANVIYDAYNSNPDSFKEMLNTVKLFDAKYKILITPGVVELGKKQYSINCDLANLCAYVFDEVWVINNVNKYAWLNGLKNDTYCVVKTFDNLTKDIFLMVDKFNSDYLVVFENDLPDCYK